MFIKKARILIVDDDQDVLMAMRLLLKSMAKEVVIEKNPNNILSLINKNKFDIIILDMNFNGLVNTGNEGIYWLSRIKEVDKEVDVILITAYGDLELAIRSLKKGASDFLVNFPPLIMAGFGCISLRLELVCFLLIPQSAVLV